MKINASSVVFDSSRTYSETNSVSTSTAAVGSVRLFQAWRQNGANERGSIQNNATMTLSEESKKLLAQLDKDKEAQQGVDGSQIGKTQAGQGSVDVNSEHDMQIRLLKRLLESLKRMREGGKDSFWKLDAAEMPHSEIKTMQQSSAASFGFGSVAIAGTGTSIALGAGVWTRQTVVSSFHSEQENTAFATTGYVQTADGRSISFNVELEMSRSFLEANQFIKEDTVQIMTDPLVINLDTNIADVTDQKFLFDLDADGNLDEISFVERGSGFLALDKNGDGKINDGSELFGTQSGNGFQDLTAYDEDGNGWIDESDSIFNKLKIWTKDKNGNDQLIAIGKAGVGAIYLGSASTDFTLKKEESGQTNGQIRRTGVYLKESGEAGTIQHVDLAL